MGPKKTRGEQAFKLNGIREDVMNNRFFKSYLIDKPFQLKFVLYCIGFNLILSGLFLFSAYRFFRNFEDMGHSAGFPSGHSFFSFIERQEYYLYTNMLWSILFVIIFALVFGVIQSHRIAGPLYRLKLELRKMKAQKKLQNISFRKDDYFQEIPAEFNEMVNHVTKD